MSTMRPLYTAEVTSTGGRQDGRVRSTDGNVALDVSLPGSDAEGTNPEELFAAGYAACFGNAVILAARRQRKDPGDVTVTSRVHLLKDDAGSYGLAVELHTTIPQFTQTDAEALVQRAHDVCPYSRAIRGNVEVTLAVQGLQAPGAA